MRSKSCLPELSFRNYCDHIFNETFYKNSCITQTERKQKPEIRLEDFKIGRIEKQQKQELKEFVNQAIRQTQYIRKEATERVKETFGHPNQWLKAEKKYFQSQDDRHKTYLECFHIETPKAINFKQWRLKINNKDKKVRSYSVRNECQNQKKLFNY